MNKYFTGFISILLVFLIGCEEKQKDNQVTEHKTTETSMKISRDTHSFALPEEAVIKHLSLDLKVNFEKKILAGKASYEIENYTKTDKIVLDTKELKIQKITLGKEEKEVKYKLADPVEYLGSALTIPVTPQTKYVHIYYKTSPASEALQWLSPQQTSDKKHPFLFTQSQAILARSWVPCQDSPGIRFTYEAEITVPNELIAVMSAENPTQKNETGVYNFKMQQPIPAYLLALTVGDIEFKEIGKETGIYAEPSVIEKAVYEFADLQKMLEAAEKIYGKYAWERYDVIVLPPSFPFGGMENPRLTFATPTIIAGDRSLTSLIAHELAHSWSGNLVTNATWDDFWLNEGFTVYFERRIMEALYGKDYSDMLAYLGYQDLQATIEDLNRKTPKDTQLKLSLEGRNPDDGMTDIAYEKGYFFLRTIEEKVGRKKLDAFLTNYFSEYAFKTMTTEGFLEYLHKQLPEAKEVNVDQWVYTSGLPENCVQVEATRFENVNQTLKKWKDGTRPETLQTKDWSSHEWLYFLRKLPNDLTIEQMTTLDATFKFTSSGNAEILAAWFEHAIAHQYEPAYPALESFLIQVGRRKFLTPLYKGLLKIEGGKERAKAIYAKARPNYHFVATNTIDELLEWSKS